MRVLLTGHEGYIGTVLAPMLVKAGHDVVGFDSGHFSGCAFMERGTEIPAVRKDVRDVRPADLEGFDAVIHLAGLSNDPLGDLDPELTDQINHRATVRLAQYARAAGVGRFLFSSSCSTYGAAGDDLLDETGALNPVTPYGIAKARAEDGLSALADASFSPVHLRSATAYGVSPMLRFDLVVNNLVAWAHTTGRILVKSDGTPWRPLVHVEDIGRAFLAVLHAPRNAVHDRAFNVGRNEENYRVREIAEMVARAAPGTRIEYAPNAGPDRRCYRVDCRAILRALPELQPKWDVIRGIGHLFAACRKVGLGAGEFEGPRFSRIAALEEMMANGRIDGTLRPRDLVRPAPAA
jgi:nucleoside-diphosphate-sugar epimerase